MQAVAASATAMQAVAASATAMQAVAASAAAMNAIGASKTARDAIFARSAALSKVQSSSMAIAKFAIGCAGKSPSSYADIAAVVKDTAAMSAIAGSSTAMSAIAGSSTAMSAICKSTIACKAIVAKISSYRSELISALADTTRFTKTAGKDVGDGAKTIDDGIGTNTIYIPVSCYDDGDTDFNAYSGIDQTTNILSVTRHSGTASVTTGVALRGVRVTGTGSSVGRITFDVYTAK